MMLRNLFLINYRNFIETGVYNLSSQIIPQFLEQLRTDIAVAQGQIKTARQILKVEKLSPDHPGVVKINPLFGIRLKLKQMWAYYRKTS